SNTGSRAARANAAVGEGRARRAGDVPVSPLGKGVLLPGKHCTTATQALQCSHLYASRCNWFGLEVQRIRVTLQRVRCTGATDSRHAAIKTRQGATKARSSCNRLPTRCNGLPSCCEGNATRCYRFASRCYYFATQLRAIRVSL